MEINMKQMNAKREKKQELRGKKEKVKKKGE